MTQLPAVLALADGSIFRGQSIGAPSNTTGEVVFNTALTGYQEILTDPSYARQIVTLTYPAHRQHRHQCRGSRSLAGVCRRPGDSRSAAARQQLAHGRAAVRISHPRQDCRHRRHRHPAPDPSPARKGAQNGCIVAGERSRRPGGHQARRQVPGLEGHGPGQGGIDQAPLRVERRHTWQETGRQNIRAHQRLHVVAYDFGIKRNILRMLSDSRLPHDGGAGANQRPRGAGSCSPMACSSPTVPGDPEPCDYAIAATRELLETDIPLFGICLGHQLLGLAIGATHREDEIRPPRRQSSGQDLDSGRVMITSQNHGFAVDEATLPANVRRPTDRCSMASLQGLACTDRPAFSFQGHPEASPGPHDVKPLFERFMQPCSAGAERSCGR